MHSANGGHRAYTHTLTHGAVRAVFSVKNVDPFIECIEISIDYIKLIE